MSADTGRQAGRKARRGAERDCLVAPADRAGWALMYSSAGYFERSLEALKLGLETDPWNANTHYMLMLNHELLGDPDGADAAYRRGKQLFPTVRWLGDDAWIWIRLGRGEVGPGYDPITLQGPLAELPGLIGDADRGLALLHRMASAPENQSPALLSVFAVWAVLLRRPAVRPAAARSSRVENRFRPVDVPGMASGIRRSAPIARIPGFPDGYRAR